MRFAGSLLSLLLVGALASCGGGGGGDSSGSGGTDGNGGGSNQNNDDGKVNPQVFLIDPATVTLTQKTTTSPFAVVGEQTAFEDAPGRCAALDGSTPLTVYESANSVTYATAGTADADQKQIAQYAEAAVQTLKQKLGAVEATAGFDGTKIRICADSSMTIGDGSAGYRTFIVATANSPQGSKTQGSVNNILNNGFEGLKRLVLHEMTHVGQKQLLGCATQQDAFERWYSEGMALRVAGQDLPYKDDLVELQGSFNSSTPTPFHDTNNTVFSVSDRYEGYRLAIDTLLGETGKQESDLFAFLRSYGSNVGCPTNATGNFKAEFDAFFSTDLRGAGLLGTQFWTIAAPRYAQP